jgi:hypothetical protein
VILGEAVASTWSRGLCGRHEGVPLAKSAGSGRDVFGNENGASSERGSTSRRKSEQSEGAGAVRR